MSFPSALALGIEGLDELMELELAQPHPAPELLERLARHASPGLTFHSVEIVPPGTRKPQAAGARYRIPIPAPRRGEVADRTARLLAASSWPVPRPGKRGPIDVRPFLRELTLEEGTLAMRLSIGRGPSAGPRDVLRALGLEAMEREGACLTRTTVELDP